MHLCAPSSCMFFHLLTRLYSIVQLLQGCLYCNYCWKGEVLLYWWIDYQAVSIATYIIVTCYCV